MKTTAEILEALNGIFRHVLKNESLNLTETTTAHDVDGWDSLTNMLLISEVEKAFGVRFNFREIVKMKNVGDLCAAIANKMKP
ncbi:MULTISPECIES: acyl carrier protein [Bacteroidaceae]|uniref:acyl carrier protein n=2 Tax=Bacteroidales TaxID=171549 RepID=UPI00033CA4DC|nr:MULTISPECIES: acyl carrier protein [Bacteroidaceae]MCL1606795.1 acyl carrier protein [Mediterranea sp. ET5]MDM8122459.1 acyl carrier protein [Mediterranea massiliensis]MDM8197905.1 acyl carrier protein [Mediterranea massiliensis]CDD82565.1 putative acyl carrier protein [Bacteroides sp. CAG:462]